MPKKKAAVRDIGLDVPVPETPCDDKKCPFHGNLRVRGQIMDCVVASTRMDQTAVVVRERLHRIAKYDRYEKRTSRFRVHNPPCLNLQPGDKVTVAECRPLSKTVSYVAIARSG
jgi:small subunit ribosomal protein S17